MVLNSCAKVNLFLKVIRKRSDGYHDIKTLFERISLIDTVRLSLRKDKQIRVICANKDVPKGSSNLCHISAKLLQDRFGVDSGVDIRITKRIPVAAGLAGGSSNAASTLLGLNRLWKLGLTEKELVSLSAQVGSDVAFFIRGGSFALGQGRGEEIKPLVNLKDTRLWHVLVIPRLKVSTPLVYGKWDKIFQKKRLFSQLTTPSADVKILTSALRKNDLHLLGKHLFNDLERATLRIYPQVKRIKDALGRLGLKAVLMSGSGPAVFAVVRSKKMAVSLAGRLRREKKAWRVFTAQTC